MGSWGVWGGGAMMGMISVVKSLNLDLKTMAAPQRGLWVFIQPLAAEGESCQI